MAGWYAFIALRGVLPDFARKMQKQRSAANEGKKRDGFLERGFLVFGTIKASLAILRVSRRCSRREQTVKLRQIVARFGVQSAKCRTNVLRAVRNDLNATGFPSPPPDFALPTRTLCPPPVFRRDCHAIFGFCFACSNRWGHIQRRNLRVNGAI